MSTDISEFFHTELFPTSASPSSSRASSPTTPGTSSSWSLGLPPTPPETILANSFPEISYGDSNSSLFNFLDDDISAKTALAASSSSDLFGGGGGVGFDFGFDFANYSTDLSSSITPFSAALIPSASSSPSTINPQLVDTPLAPVKEEPADEEDDEKEQEKSGLTLKINPVKVAGHGKARKGTVQSGGVAKKASSVPPPQTPLPMPTAATISSVLKENFQFKEEPKDDFPEDWRPSPEVLAQMTSKEKRQLRNKISARNFRNRRKEYISTLEMDIAERDRLLTAIRNELGSTQSENIALRQEVATLKKALLEGRTTTGATLTAEDIPSLKLPPPGPLPPALSATTQTSSTSLVTANTQKDIPLSPRVGNAFWGGIASSGSLFGTAAGGVTPVHTVLVPELSELARNVNLETPSPRSTQIRNLGLENIDPALNNHRAGFGSGSGKQGLMDSNPFLMKHWQNSGTSNNNNSYPSSSKAYPPSPPTTFTKPSFLPSSPRPTPFTDPAKAASSSKLIKSPTDMEREMAYMATLATQTLLGKLGGAFWEAFSNGSAASVDVEKVRRVLEGKAVIRVVDVDSVAPSSSAPPSPTLSECSLPRSLEDSMRNLSLTKRA